MSPDAMIHNDHLGTPQKIQFFYSIALQGIEASYGYLLMLTVYSALALFTYKGSNIATWIIIVSVLLSGAGAFLMGVSRNC